MATPLHTSEQLIEGLREARFFVKVGEEDVPGLLVLPASPEKPVPLVLLQHPATSSKDDYFVRDVALDWAKRGWACGGIDAPLHGDRRDYDPMRLFREPGRYPEIRAQFAKELSATIDAIGETFPVDLGRIGYVGFSLGSMLGIPAVARDGRFKTAAFCLVGEGGLVGAVEGPEADVPRLGGIAVRIVAKTADELVPRASTEALYKALPGEKDILWLPGGHFEIGPDVIRVAGDWMRTHL